MDPASGERGSRHFAFKFMVNFKDTFQIPKFQSISKIFYNKRWLSWVVPRLDPHLDKYMTLVVITTGFSILQFGSLETIDTS
jgi:hypothetical protein